MYFSILAGGSGKRFWPVSRKRLPKQFISIIDERTMFEHTIDRILPLAEKDKIFVITSVKYRDILESIIEKKYKDLGIRTIYEPFPKDTAPAVGLVNEMIYREDPDAVVVSLHSDHYIEKEADFRNIIKAGTERAKSNNDIVLIGIKPDKPATGYGYIETGMMNGNINGQAIHKVISFKEKPDRDTAFKYIKDGSYLWNSGMFIWKASKVLSEIKEHEPEMYEGLKKIDLSKIVEYAGIFSEFKKIAIDNAVLEKTRQISVIPADIGWSDVGTWVSIHELKSNNPNDNIIPEKSMVMNSKGCFVKTNNGKLISIIGLEDIIFVETDDVVLLTKKSEVQNIKNLYDILEEKGNFEEYL